MNPQDPYGANPGTPPGASPYPRFSGRTPRREIEIGAIGEAWGIVSKNWAPFVLAGFLALVVGGIVYAVSVMIFMGGAFAAAAAGDSTAAQGLGFGMQFLMTVVMAAAMYTLTSFFMAGIINMGLKAVRGGTPTVSDLFEAFSKNPGGIVVVSLLVGLMVGIGNAFFYLPGIILGGLSMLSLPLVVDKGLGPIDAIKESFSLCSKNIVMASVVYLLGTIVAGLGICLCFVGVMLTYPLFYVTQAIVYEDLTADTGPSY